MMTKAEQHKIQQEMRLMEIEKKVINYFNERLSRFPNRKSTTCRTRTLAKGLNIPWPQVSRITLRLEKKGILTRDKSRVTYRFPQTEQKEQEGKNG